MGERMKDKTITAVLNINEYQSIKSLEEKIGVKVTGLMVGDCLEENENLRDIIEKCWEAISEAGYEDDCFGLSEIIEKAIG